MLFLDKEPSGRICVSSSDIPADLFNRMVISNGSNVPESSSKLSTGSKYPVGLPHEVYPSHSEIDTSKVWKRWVRFRGRDGQVYGGEPVDANIDGRRNPC